jgi:CCR4-NOT complex subunit CAF16
MCLKLPQGSRCLLIGANGAGKTTLLKIIAGKHMVGREQVVVLGASPFHHTELTTSGELAYVGGNWTRDIAFAGTSIPLTVSGNCHTMLATNPAGSQHPEQRTSCQLAAVRYSTR